MQRGQRRVAWASLLAGLVLALPGFFGSTPRPEARATAWAGLSQETLDTIDLLARMEQVGGFEHLSRSEQRSLLALAQESGLSVAPVNSTSSELALRWGGR